MLAVYLYGVIFFFKQKTAYEMRISDWSSDVCSSDLGWRSPAAKPNTPALKPWPTSALYRRPEGVSASIETPMSSAVKSRLAAAGAWYIAAIKIGRASCRGRVCQYV